MFKKILIANRGEIALRIIRACRELGHPDGRGLQHGRPRRLHVTYADEDVCIGPPPSSASYLNISAIISAAEITGADAIHPGYGFLAENAHFAEVLRGVQASALIGPRPEVIRLMGDKAQARETAAAAGVPVLPGSREPLADAAEAERVAAEVGYPVILKAAAGGGGRGMRIVHADERDRRPVRDRPRGGREGLRQRRDLPREVPDRAAPHRVPDPRRPPRQRRPPRRARLLDPAPPPEADRGIALAGPHARAARGDGRGRGQALPRTVGYENAGTIEFLLDERRPLLLHGDEHPHPGRAPGHRDGHRHRPGEAADPGRGRRAARASAQRPQAARPCHRVPDQRRGPGDASRPRPGRSRPSTLPAGPGTRVDTHAYEDYVIPPHYDSLVAKLIVHDRSREEAIARMRRALDFFVVEGIHTTIPLHQRIMRDPTSSPASSRPASWNGSSRSGRRR